MPTALVTGASARLGATIARHLAANGYTTIIHVNRSEREGRKVVSELTDSGHDAKLMACDFRKSAAVARFFEKVVKLHGVPDLIVNNASVFNYDFPGKASIDKLEASLAVHVKAPFLITELAWRKSRRTRPVTVINILDQKLLNLNPDYYSYTIGKFGLMAITRMWQVNPSPRMRVFGILPGLLFPSGHQTQEDFDRVKNNTVLGQSPSPAEIADAVLFLARNKSIAGQNLTIDGGESLVRRVRDIAFE